MVVAISFPIDFSNAWSIFSIIIMMMIASGGRKGKTLNEKMSWKEWCINCFEQEIVFLNNTIIDFHIVRYHTPFEFFFESKKLAFTIKWWPFFQFNNLFKKKINHPFENSGDDFETKTLIVLKWWKKISSKTVWKPTATTRKQTYFIHSILNWFWQPQKTTENKQTKLISKNEKRNKSFLFYNIEDLLIYL